MFTTNSLLETPSFSMEDLIRAFESLNVWEASKKKHDNRPERGDGIIIPDWVIQTALLPKIHYHVIKGGR